MIDMTDIIREGHPTLRLEATDLTFPLTDEIKNTAAEMMTFLKNSQDPDTAKKYKLRPGVGLAAPQIDRSEKLIVVHVPGEDDETEDFSRIMINPKIVSHTSRQIALNGGEGCLSVDREVEGYVPRAKRITVEYYDLDGEKHRERFRNFEAIVVQHEIDHLHGVMFYDHIDPNNPLRMGENLELV